VETQTSRAYAWALQTGGYQSAILPGKDRFTEIIATDTNLIDYQPTLNDDADWSTGWNTATDEWLVSHDCSVNHTLPAFISELGRVFYLNLGAYAVTAIMDGGSPPKALTKAKKHSFKPQDFRVSRQGKAVTYVEKTGLGYNVWMPWAVGNGFTLRGDGLGVLTCDFGLHGNGSLNLNPATAWSGSNSSIKKLSGLHKLYNTQVKLEATDGSTNLQYGCRYRSFEVTYEQTLLLDAGYQPGCGRFLIAGDPTSGIVRSALEFDRQNLNFTFNVDMAAGSKELDIVQKQRPIKLVITAVGGTIEGNQKYELKVTIPVAKYSSSQPTESEGILQFAVSGRAFFDFAQDELFNIELINDVATYASGW
jgi:hypothetical protein